MALSDVLGPIRRRWYIVLVGLLLAVGMGWGTAVLAPSAYTARGLVMLLPSPLTTGPKGNPLLNLGGLELPARVLIAYYSSEPAKADLEKLAPKSEVTVSMEESTRGPIIAVDVKDVTPEGALKVLHYVTDSIPENLARIQNEVGTAQQAAVGSMPLVLDAEAERDISGLVRLVVAAVVAMLALTFFVVFSLDGIMLRRRSGRDEAAATAEDIQVGEQLDPQSKSSPTAGDPYLVVTADTAVPMDAEHETPIAAEEQPATTAAHDDTTTTDGKLPPTATAVPATDVVAAENEANGVAKPANGTDGSRTSDGSRSTRSRAARSRRTETDQASEDQANTTHSDDTRTSRALA